MVKVKNVKVEELSFETKDKNFQRCMSYAKSINPDFKAFMPKRPKHRVRFELEGANADLANCIRRYLLDEVPVYSMHVDDDEIKTKDMFILNDYLKKNIELVPFKQELSDPDAISLSMDIENKTEDTIIVRGSDLDITVKGKKEDIGKYITPHVHIGNLRSGHSLNIAGITIVKGRGKDDYGKFLLPSNVYYEILDVKPRLETKYEKTGSSSLNSTPTHFKLGYTTHRNISPKKVMVLCCDEIIKNFEEIKKDMANIKETDTSYFSDLINLETKGETKHFVFIGHFRTTVNVISRYCYLANKDIKFVAPAIIHPSIEKGVVKIASPQSVKVINTAVKNIIADAQTVKKAFL